MRVLNAGYAPNIGGKHFDEKLADHFIREKKLRLNKRARCRLIAECEKVKKQMSANSNELPINIECLQDDKDFSARIDRNAFEDMSKDLLNRIHAMLHETYTGALEKYQKDFGEKFGDFKVDSVEVVGGTSRIPAIKRLIKDIFKIEPSTTLNADEAVARGCALQCAILSPTFKVARELQIIDSFPYQINFRYASAGTDFKTVTALYPKGHQFPFTKQISLTCQTLPITAAFDYIDSKGNPVTFAQFEIRQPENNPIEIGQNNPVKLRVRLDANGLFSIVAATVTSDKLAEVKNGEPMDQSTNESAGEKMETDDGTSQNNSDKSNGPQQESQKEEEPKRKSKPKAVDLVIVPAFIVGKLEKDVIQKYLELESNLILADKNWKEKTDAKNALEEFIYEWRDRLETNQYDSFMSDEVKEAFQAKLSENESWLFQQDEEEKMHSKSVYDERTNAMATAFANNLIFRKREFENRPRLLTVLGSRLQQAEKLCQHTEHDEQEEFDKFSKEVQEMINWFDQAQGKIMNAKSNSDPPIKCEDIQKKTGEVDAAITKLQNGRNRRAEQKRKAAETAAAEAKKQAEQAKEEAGDGGTAPTGDNMEVDPDQQQNSA